MCQHYALVSLCGRYVDLVIEEGVKGSDNRSRKIQVNTWNVSMKPVLQLFLLFQVLALAKRMEKIGADAVIAEGMEAGGISVN